MKRDELINALYESIGETCVTESDVGHIEIHSNEVLGVHLVPGFEVEVEELSDGIRATITVRKNQKIEQPVRICFGLLEESGTQKIDMKIRLEEKSRVAILASCTFPNAVEIVHTMDAQIEIGKRAEYILPGTSCPRQQGGREGHPQGKDRFRRRGPFPDGFRTIKRPGRKN